MAPPAPNSCANTTRPTTSISNASPRKSVKQNPFIYKRLVDLPELRDCIGAADVYIAHYLNERQIVSGTFAYAFGAGKAVVSTPYWHAAELLADGRGALVPFANSQAIAREVCDLLRNPARLLAMRETAHHVGRDMIWSRAAKHYCESIGTARTVHAATHRQSLLVRTLGDEPMHLPKLNPAHVLRMSDLTGMLQHALFSAPNYAHGYCTDDNARTLILTLHWEKLGETLPVIAALTTTYTAFLAHAFNAGNGRFLNFMGYDRRWLEAKGSEDSHGRAV